MFLSWSPFWSGQGCWDEVAETAKFEKNQTCAVGQTGSPQMCGPCVQCLKIILLQNLKPLSWVRVSRSGLSDSIMKVGRQAHCCWADICRAVQVSRKYQCVSFGKWSQQVVKLQPKILSVFQMCQCVKHLDINQNYHQQQQWSVLGKIDGLVWYTVPFMCSCYHFEQCGIFWPCINQQ